MTKVTLSPEQRTERMDAAHAELTAAAEAISSSDDWRAFLDFARKLHSYSAQNRMWLFQQARFSWGFCGSLNPEIARYPLS